MRGHSPSLLPFLIVLRINAYTHFGYQSTAFMEQLS